MPDVTEPPDEIHRVAVVVIVDAPGDDARDARNVAEAAVQQALPASFPVTTPDGTVRTVRGVAVAEINVALQKGMLHMRA